MRISGLATFLAALSSTAAGQNVPGPGDIYGYTAPGGATGLQVEVGSSVFVGAEFPGEADPHDLRALAGMRHDRFAVFLSHEGSNVANGGIGLGLGFDYRSPAGVLLRLEAEVGIDRFQDMPEPTLRGGAILHF